MDGSAESTKNPEPATFGWAYVVAKIVLLAAAVTVLLMPIMPGLLKPTGTVDTWLFFDGECNLCDGFINFVADTDSDAVVKFGAIQKHQRKLAARGAPTDLSTLVLVQGDDFYTHSGAALRVFALLPQPYAAVSAFYIVPPIIRDAVYRFVAAHRYEWFGHADECRAPTPEFEARFLIAESEE
jgi:predicted DCC family thiol-disulfide oxidoreductase YuxK